MSFFAGISQFVGAVLVLGFLLAVRKGLKVMKLRSTHRDRLDRVLPVLEMVIGALYLLWVLAMILPDIEYLTWAVAALVVATGVIAGWFAIRDFVTGAVLRAEHTFEPGAWLQADAVEGFIDRVGYRTLGIETDAGLKIRLPYSRLSAMPIAVASQTETVRAHSFLLKTGADETVSEKIARVRALALTAFWSSPGKEPHVRLVEKDADGYRFEVTVFALYETYSLDIESAIRQALEEPVAG